MITKAFIIEKQLDTNKFFIRIPIFEKPGISSNESKLNNTIFLATLSHEPTSFDSYNIGDCVFVGFENNDLGKPVILGKLFLNKESERSIGALSSSSLVVKDKAVLPNDTTIGDTSLSNIINFFSAVNDTINKKDLFVDTIKFSSTNPFAGLVRFDDTEGTLQVKLSEDVEMALGIDTILKVYNDTDDTLLDGQIVYNTGNTGVATKVELAIANNHLISNNTLGVVTEHIEGHSYGFITRQGYVGGLLLDPSTFSLNDPLYLSPTEPGAFTNQKPVAPNFVTQVGYVNKLSSDSSSYDGQIYVDIRIIPISSDISYDNSSSQLSSQTVKGALDELSLKKADISMLSSNITLYRTVVASDISGYNKLVTSTTDVSYSTIAVEFQTGTITGTTVSPQYISGSVSLAGLFVGNPGQINIYSVGRARKVSGNNNQNAEFFFRVYRRESNGTEHLVATSATTGKVSSTEWLSFSATALLDNGEFAPTDRIVVKSYAIYADNPGGVFAYEIGGNVNPFRVLLPVPVSVIPTPLASAIITDVSHFNGILSSDDTNVQLALNTLDNHSHVLPISTTTQLGVVKTGSGLHIDVDGTLSVSAESVGVKIILAPTSTPPDPISQNINVGDFWYEY